ncbi:TPA: hypothetical protein HA335_04570 [Methanocaldococcus jannaschii]|nr:hypothetical protein [Methanocaldococcus jannaschii]HII59834.1 hypothetical protein [Methanocaldococcus jannaschii]
MPRRKIDKLYVKIYFEGNAIEGEYDFDAVTHLKNGILKYLWTGKKDPIIIWNMDNKSFTIIDPSKICAVEVQGSLMFLDDIPEKKLEMKSFSERD